LGVYTVIARVIHFGAHSVNTHNAGAVAYGAD
jgi:hypothetical protein